MTQWSIKMNHEIDLSETIIDPCWIPNSDKNRGKKLSEKVSDSFYITGNKEFLLKEILEGIQKAKQTICICSFIISEERIVNELIRSAERGVNIYILTASEKRLKDPSLARDEVEADDIKEHENILNQLAGKVLVRTADFFHSKFILFDSHNLTQRSGFLLSPNLAKKTFDRKLELGLKLNSIEVGELFKQFIIAFWELSDHELLEPNRIRGVKKKIIISEKKEINEYFNPTMLYTLGVHTKLKEAITHLIKNSEGPLYISSFSFRKDYELIDLLKEEAKKRKLIIFARPRSPSMPALVDLGEAGANIYGHPNLHAKGLVGHIKGQPTGIVMTANFESLGLDEGFETGLLLDTNRTNQLLSIFTNWKTTFPEKLRVGMKRGDFRGDFKIWNGRNKHNQRIEPEKVINLGSYHVQNFADLETFKPKFSKYKEENVIYQKITYEWENLPPLLPEKADFVEKKKKFEIYENNNKKYLVIEKQRDLKSAQKIAMSEEAIVVIKE